MTKPFFDHSCLVLLSSFVSRNSTFRPIGEAANESPRHKCRGFLFSSLQVGESLLPISDKAGFPFLLFMRGCSHARMPEQGKFAQAGPGGTSPGLPGPRLRDDWGPGR